MTQKSKPRKRRLPKDIAERPDHEIMEKLFGKRVMKKVAAIVADRSKDVENKGD